MASMTEEETTLGLVKAAIFDLPAADQARVKACAEKLRETVTEAGPAGCMALALVGAEWAAKS